MCTDFKGVLQLKVHEAGIIFWRDFAIFAHFFTQNRMKIVLKREKIALTRFRDPSRFCSLKHMRTILRHLACFLVGFPYFLAPNYFHRKCG